MTASKYKINTELLITSLLPISKRLPIYESLIEAYDSPLQRLNDNMIDYVYGSSYSTYLNSFTYSLGDKVLATASNLYSIYESQTNNNFNKPLGGTSWGLWNEFKIGMIERANIRSNVMLFEYGLNQYYGTTFSQPTGVTFSAGHSDIYITDNIIRTPVFISGGPLNSNNVYQKTSDGFIFGTGSDIAFLDEHFYSSAQYNINVPILLYNSLPSPQSNIRTIADKYNSSGILYKIITY